MILKQQHDFRNKLRIFENIEKVVLYKVLVQILANISHYPSNMAAILDVVHTGHQGQCQLVFDVFLKIHCHI